MLPAHLLDDLRNLWEMAVIDGRKQVMLNLEAEPAGEKEGQHAREPSSASERMAGLHLVSVVARVPHVNVLRGEVVHLRADHETERHDPDRNHREEHSIEPRAEQSKEESTIHAPYYTE